MADLLTGATPTHLWYQAVQAAEVAVDASLPEAMESYLVFLPLQFTRDNGLSEGALGLEYLAAEQQPGSNRAQRLRGVGDRCLLHAGLFPERAARRRVNVGYFIDLGRAAYGSLGSSLPGEQGRLYASVALEFIRMTEVLTALRPATTEAWLAAVDRWQAGSHAARQSLSAVCDPHLLHTYPRRTQ